MAINPADSYENTNPADTDYPYGSAKNITTPGDATGTPLEKDWMNDIWGFFQKLLQFSDQTASGSPDKVGASQYFDAIKLTMSRSIPVGSICWSNLTQEQFNDANEVGSWLLMDGRSAAGTKYEELFSSVVPDLSGRFIRSTGGYAEDVSEDQDDATARNGITLTWQGSFNADPSRASWSSTNASFSGGSHTHNNTMFGNGGTPVGGRMAIGDAYSYGNSATTSSTSHSHTINRNQFNSSQVAHSHTINLNAFNNNQVWLEDVETRPKNKALYCFIKVDY